MHIHLDITLPVSELESLLTRLSLWDAARPDQDIVIQFQAEAPELTMAEVQAILTRIRPALHVQAVPYA